MWAATRGLQQFIMKGIHRSVPALPLSTQFFHTGPPSLPLVALPLICPFFFLLLHISFSIKFGAKGGLWVCRVRWERERGRGSRSAGQLGDQRGAMLVTSPSTRPIYWQRLMRTRVLTVPGHLRSSAGWVDGWVEGGGGTTGLSTSLAARQSALWALACLLDCRGHTHTHTTARPPTREHGQSWFKMVEEAQQTHAAYTHWCCLHKIPLHFDTWQIYSSLHK